MEFSNELAIEIATESYPGDVEFVNKTQSEWFEKTVWFVGIKNLVTPLGSGNNTVDKIKVPVDLKEYEILSPLVKW